MIYKKDDIVISIPNINLPFKSANKVTPDSYTSAITIFLINKLIDELPIRY